LLGFEAARLLGGDGAGRELGAWVTALVAAEVALVEPRLLEETTLNRRVEATSDATTIRESLVAPLTGAQLEPAPSQRSHWYEYLIPVPVHVPALPVSVAPTVGVPLIVGATVFTGALCCCPFAARLPLAKRLRETAITPAVASQGF
jgi:hypothetical protein